MRESIHPEWARPAETANRPRGLSSEGELPILDL